MGQRPGRIPRDVEAARTALVTRKYGKSGSVEGN
jgi:hypothetical protein